MLKDFHSETGLNFLFLKKDSQKLKKQAFVEGLYLKVDEKLPLAEKKHLIKTSPYAMRIWGQDVLPVYDKNLSYYFNPTVFKHEHNSFLEKKETQISFTIKYQAGFSIKFAILFSPRKTKVTAKLAKQYYSEEEIYRGKIENDQLFDLIVTVIKKLEKRVPDYIGWAPLSYLLQSCLTKKQNALSKSKKEPSPSLKKFAQFINSVAKALSLKPKLTPYGGAIDSNVFLPPLLSSKDKSRFKEDYLYTLRVKTGAQGFISNILRKLKKYKNINQKTIQEIIYPIGNVAKDKTYVYRANDNYKYGRIVSFTENTYRIRDLSEKKPAHRLNIDAFTQREYDSLPPLKRNCEILPTVYEIFTSNKKPAYFQGYIKYLTRFALTGFWNDRGKILEYGYFLDRYQTGSYISSTVDKNLIKNYPYDGNIKAISFNPFAMKKAIKLKEQSWRPGTKGDAQRSWKGHIIQYIIAYNGFRVTIDIGIIAVNQKFRFIPHITIKYNTGRGDLRDRPSPPYYITKDRFGVVMRRLSDEFTVPKNESPEFVKGLRKAFDNAFKKIQNKTNYLKNPNLIGGVPVWYLFYKAMGSPQRGKAPEANLSRVQWKAFLIRLFKKLFPIERTKKSQHSGYKITYKDFKFAVSDYNSVEITPKTEEAKKVLENMFERTEDRDRFIRNRRDYEQTYSFKRQGKKKLSNQQLTKLAEDQPFIFRTDPGYYSVVKCNWYLTHFSQELKAYLSDLKMR